MNLGGWYVRLAVPTVGRSVVTLILLLMLAWAAFTGRAFEWWLWIAILVIQGVSAWVFRDTVLTEDP